MRKLAIIQFNPIELYPPVLNWLNFLAEKCGDDIEVRVFTMSPAAAFTPFVSDAKNIHIVRAGRLGKKGIKAYWNYLLFYLTAFLQLLRWRPGIVLYYETISALPALWYRKYWNRRAELYIHYHEYTSPEEYQQGMVLGRWLHRMEKRTYSRAAWISHTNQDRMDLFLRDLGQPSGLSVFILPNYPPRSWQRAGRDETIGLPVRMVYVGALSMDTMYTRELAEWVIGQSGKVTLDIYSDNHTPEAAGFLDSLGSDLVRFKKGVNYFSLPAILGEYHIGVILYKGHIPNYVYNAPNKLFEYMACGLDVWFPVVMKGCYPYITQEVYPKVMAADFDNLSSLDWPAAIDRSGLEYAVSSFYAENVLGQLLYHMKQKRDE